MGSDSYHPALHRLALLTACATFPLIFMGGLVTSHGAGMAVPDWPNSYGYNMFTFPPSKWIGGIFYEHTHRLMGTVVGMLSIALCVGAWRTEPRRWVRWLATGVLGAVIIQGVLGGLRVVLVELDLAIVHACFAQAFFCLTGLMCVVTSRWWHSARGTGFQPVRTTSEYQSTQHGLKTRATRSSIIRLAAIAVIAIYLQLIAGAVMRHYEAGLAIPDFPLAYGRLIPPLTQERLLDNATILLPMTRPIPTIAQVWLHFSHRIGAVLVTTAVAWLVTNIIRKHRDEPGLLRPAIVLVGLILIQITLGILTVLLRKPADIASAHVAVGALCLLTTFVTLVRSIRLYAPLPETKRGFEMVPTSEALATA